MARKSAPLAASSGSAPMLTEPPVRAAMTTAVATTAGAGAYCAGPQIRTCIPAVAPPSR